MAQLASELNDKTQKEPVLTEPNHIFRYKMLKITYKFFYSVLFLIYLYFTN